jgi:hypothetical protein
MKAVLTFLSLPLILCLAQIPLAHAGEALVAKSTDGKFLPAVANEWAKAGEHSFRFILKAGAKAPDVAKELTDKIAPISVTASDDFTLLFEGADLTETALLEKLASIPITTERGAKDAVAALSNLGGEGPALSDLSSAGSIRVSKKIDLPGAQQKPDGSCLVGTVVKVCDCQTPATVVLKILTQPRLGHNRNSFWRGQIVIVHGADKRTDTNEPDLADPSTQINPGAKDLKPGDKVFGRPVRKEGEEWVLETLQKM